MNYSILFCLCYIVLRKLFFLLVCIITGQEQFVSQHRANMLINWHIWLECLLSGKLQIHSPTNYSTFKLIISIQNESQKKIFFPHRFGKEDVPIILYIQKYQTKIYI